MISFIGVGPQRSGTTWLHEVLSTHPEVALPRDVKETMFFDQYFDKGMEWYLSHYQSFDDKTIQGEICPTYFTDEKAPTRIALSSPNCRIIVSIRNPVENAISLYRHHFSKGRVAGTFMEAKEQYPQLLESGHYSKYIPHWLQLFDRSLVKFVWLDEIIAKPDIVFEQLCDFLGICHIPLPALAKNKVYAQQSSRFPLLTKSTMPIYYWLRERRLLGLVEFSKRLGVKKLFFTSTNRMVSDITDYEREWLRSYFSKDILFLETYFDMELSSWMEQSDSYK